MKTIVKRNKMITDADIDGPMMSGKGMSKTEIIEMAKWVEEQKVVAKSKKSKKVT